MACDGRRLLLAVLAMLYSATLLAQDQLTLGVQADRPQALLREQYALLGDYLQAQLDGPSVVVRLLSLDGLTQAISQHALDLVLVNPAYFFVIRSQNVMAVPLATLVRRADAQATASAGGVIITRAHAPRLQALQDLVGRKIASPGRAHFGGYAAQVYELSQAGLPAEVAPDLLKVASHDAAVQAVLDQRADAAFIRTGLLEAMSAEGLLDLADLTVLNRQALPGFPYLASTRLYPEWPLLAFPQVGEQRLRRLVSTLLALDADHPAARALGIDGFAPPADYLPVERVLSALELLPVDLQPPLAWGAIWAQHRLLIVATTVVLITLALMVLLLMQRNRALIHSRAALATQRQRLANVLEGTRVGSWEWNVKTGEARFDARWAEFIGYRLDELEPISIATWTRFTHPDDLAQAEAVLQSHFRGERDYYEVELRMRHRDGHWVWVQDRGKLISRDEAGHPHWMAGTHADITQRKLIEECLRRAASVFIHARESILITDASGTIIDANAATTAMTGYAKGELIGRKLRAFRSARHSREFYACLLRELVYKGNWSGEHWSTRKSGGPYAQLLTISAVRNASGTTESYVALFSDITPQKQRQDRLESIAYFDALTGLPNRLLLLDRLQQAMAQVRRRGNGLAVVYLDLDGFKAVNDTHGHAMGDQLLTRIAQRLQRCLRPGDTIARLGGDEFVAVLNDLEQETDCVVLLERILAAVSCPFVFGELELTVSASLGVSFYPQKKEIERDQLLHQADQAMYRAKANGRNQYQAYSAALDQTLHAGDAVSHR